MLGQCSRARGLEVEELWERCLWCYMCDSREDDDDECEYDAHVF